MRWQPASRRLFEHHRSQPPSSLTDIERAARFFYLQKNTWGGKRTRQNFHFGVTKPPSYDSSTLAARLKQVAARLDRVQLEALPYEVVLAQYDRPSTFYFLDPPYVGVELYQHNFSNVQFEELARRLHTLKGRFLLSLNDCPQARTWFGTFHSLEVTLTYTTLRTPRLFRELLFANYPLPPTFPAP